MKDIDQIRRDNLRLLEQESDGLAAIANIVGMSPAQFANLREGAKDSKTGKPRGMRKETARRIEAASGKPAGWLDVEHNSNIRDASISAQQQGEIVKSIAATENTMGLSNDEPGLKIEGKVPLISWDQARTWDLLMTPLHKDDARSWLACPAPHSNATFCIENNTETMDDGTRDGYREGDILFVDPAVVAVADKDVVVILPNGRMLFRRLKEDGEGPYLLALNGKRIERWEEGTTVRGVVIFSGNFR